METKAIIPVGIKKPKRTNKRKQKLKKNLLFKNLFFDKHSKKASKFITTNINLPNVGYDSANSVKVTLLNGLDEGPGQGERIGAEGMLESVYYRLFIVPPKRPGIDASGPYAVATNAIRATIVYDRYPKGVLAKYYDAADLTNSIFNGENIDDMASFTNSERFLIVSDEIIRPEDTTFYQILGAGTTGIVAIDYLQYTKNYRKMKLKVKWNYLTTNVIGALNEGALYLCLTGFNSTSNVNGTNNSSTVYGDVRVRYTDV